MRVYLTRHGQTDWNAEDKVLGRTDVPLNEAGLAQAGQLAQALSGEPIDLVITSPLTRTVQTGRIVAEALGVPAVTADALIEMDFGVFEGVLRGDPRYQAEKKRYFARLEGGESYLDVAGRAYPFLQSLPKLVPQILEEKGKGNMSAVISPPTEICPSGQRENNRVSCSLAGREESSAAIKEDSLAQRGNNTDSWSAALRAEDPNVLLVSHNGICRVICSYFRDMENDEFRTFQLGNCSVLQFEM